MNSRPYLGEHTILRSHSTYYLFVKEPKKQPTISSAVSQYIDRLTGCQAKSFYFFAPGSNRLTRFPPVFLSAVNNTTSPNPCQAVCTL